VHGHWTIEVRNPDGTLATHREFENNLIGGNYDGAAFIAAVLSRTVTVGSWGISLKGASGKNFIVIDEPNSSMAALDSTNCASSPGGSTYTCSTSLSISGPNATAGGGLAGNTNAVTLTGSASVPQGYPSTITLVETDNYPCTAPSTTTACLDSGNVGIGGVTLTGSFTPVPVTAGQTVAVTVVISFQ
jgi:hypothetical protein